MDTETWDSTIARLRTDIGAVFGALCERAARGEALLDTRPARGGWTAREVLEHVTLTDKYLLLLADKIAAKSRKRAERGEVWPAHGPRFDHLGHLAGRELEWSAPEHMVPRGGVSTAELLQRLAADRARALELLDGAPGGLGTLHRIRMSVVGGDDDRLDLYQYLEVLCLHAARHVAQIDRC